MDIATFYRRLWEDYVELAPQAQVIYGLFAQDNPRVVNDHVAFRTFDLPLLNIEHLEPHLLALGYRRHQPYDFPDKHLTAWSYVHQRLQDAPLVFLSQLQVDALSERAQAVVRRLAAAVDPARLSDPAVFWSGRLWPAPTYVEYRALADESEYAAWLAALGYHANHFTVAVHRLLRPTTLAGVVERVEAAGYRINLAGGRIKGSQAELLEQASTLAERRLIDFADGRYEIPTCYYEFARRYPGADGQLYQGFVAASAGRIFESTHLRPAA